MMSADCDGRARGCDLELAETITTHVEFHLYLGEG